MPDNTCDACKIDAGDSLSHNEELGIALCPKCEDFLMLGGAARRLVIIAVTGLPELPKPTDPTTRAFAGDDDYGWDRNPHYNPAKCDLTNVVTLDVPDLSYEYDTIIVVIDNPTGDLYAASDSGCSCPTPFENVNGLADMTPIRTIEDFERLFAGRGSYRDFASADVFAARRKVRDVLRLTSAHERIEKASRANAPEDSPF